MVCEHEVIMHIMGAAAGAVRGRLARAAANFVRMYIVNTMATGI